MSEGNITPTPCPCCGGEMIGVENMIIATPWRGEAKKVWAYCKTCGKKGAEVICDVGSPDSEELAAAFGAWNN